MRRGKNSVGEAPAGKAQTLTFNTPNEGSPFVGFVTQKDRVPRPALFQPPSHMLHFDLESSMSQPLLEFPVLSRRPHRQHPARLQSREGRRDSAIIVQPVI